jgi:hypothetical protein
MRTWSPPSTPTFCSSPVPQPAHADSQPPSCRHPHEIHVQGTAPHDTVCPCWDNPFSIAHSRISCMFANQDYTCLRSNGHSISSTEASRRQ